MQNIKKLPLLLVLLLVGAMVLAACGDSTTATTATTTAAVATTSAATTTTTAAATTPAATTTAAATTPAATTTASAATTTASAATTTASAATTTAAASTTGPQIAATSALRKPAATGGNFTTISLSGELAPDLHPYPSAGNFTQTWTDVATYLFAGSLVTYNYETQKFEYSFAKDLKVSSDGKTYTFTLKDGLKWSDGSEVTVADYQYAYDNAIKQDKANPDNDYVGIDDLLKITSFKTDATAKSIVVTLDDVYATDLALNYANGVTPVPSKIWSGKDWRDATKNPEILKPTVVSGPYTVESYDQKAQAVLKVNPNYFRGKGGFDTITLKTGAAAIVLEAVKTGQADWAYNIPSTQYQQAKDDSSVKLYEWAAVNATYRTLEYNTARAPFNDKAFRLAMNYAVDKEKLLKLAERGLGTPRATFVSPSSPFYNKNVNEYKFNIETAKKAFADAGYKTDGGNLLGKDGKPITLTVVYPTTSKPRELIATALQQDLKSVGITVNVDGKEFQAFVDQVNKKDYDFSLGAYGGGFPDPDGFKTTVVTDATQNKTSYKNPKIDDLFKTGAKELDATKRKAIYDEAQKIINEDSPILFLWDINSFSVFSPKVQGIADASGKPYSKGDRLDYADSVLTWSKAQ